jgi:hypothetical protein
MKSNDQVTRKQETIADRTVRCYDELATGWVDH